MQNQTRGVKQTTYMTTKERLIKVGNFGPSHRRGWGQFADSRQEEELSATNFSTACTLVQHLGSRL
jgi:hypothetical protein